VEKMRSILIDLRTGEVYSEEKGWNWKEASIRENWSTLIYHKSGILGSEKKQMKRYAKMIKPVNITQEMVEHPEGDWVKWEDVKDFDWISVEDKLPDKDASYLIHAPSADPKSPWITCAWYDPRIPAWSMLPECWLKAITHWMPLPKEPDGGEKDEP